MPLPEFLSGLLKDNNFYACASGTTEVARPLHIKQEVSHLTKDTVTV